MTAATRTRRARWTREEVLKALLAREAAGMAMDASSLYQDDRYLYAGIRRCFGNWDTAMRAAGIDPDRHRLHRRWSRQAVVDCIKQRAHRGLPLNCGAIDAEDITITQAGVRYYGSWDNALAAAGFDPARWRKRRVWTTQNVSAAIREIHDQGGKLYHAALARTGLTAAGTRLFGSWDAALQAAGLDPSQVRVHRKPWTVQEILRELQRRHAAGQAITAKIAASSGLYKTACRALGNWDAVLRAAGLDPEGIRGHRRPWDPDSIVQTLQQKFRTGEAINFEDVAPRSIVHAGRRLFGSWDAALEAAGLDPVRIRRHQKAWTRQALAKELQQKHRAGEALCYGLVSPRWLIRSARHLFGSWDAALEAAGINPATVRRRRGGWSRSEILAELRRKSQMGEPLNVSDVKPESIRGAACRWFGSWNDALRAADLDPNRIRRNRWSHGRAAGVGNSRGEFPVWTKVSVVEGILVRQQLGQPLYCRAVVTQARLLYDAGCRRFGSWREALRAAGIDPASVRRTRMPWTRDEIVAELRRCAKASKKEHRPAYSAEAFVKAARRLFGSWQNALAAARLDESKIQKLGLHG